MVVDPIRQALLDYLVVRQFRRLSKELIPYADAQGIFSDEDVFKRVS